MLVETLDVTSLQALTPTVLINKRIFTIHLGLLSIKRDIDIIYKIKTEKT